MVTVIQRHASQHQVEMTRRTFQTVQGSGPVEEEAAGEPQTAIVALAFGQQNDLSGACLEAGLQMAEAQKGGRRLGHGGLHVEDARQMPWKSQA